MLYCLILVEKVIFEIFLAENNDDFGGLLAATETPNYKGISITAFKC